MAITVTPIAGALGAEISGFDVRDPAPGMPEVFDALHEHGVIFVRGAQLSEEEQLELGRHFGEPSLFPTARICGMTHRCHVDCHAACLRAAAVDDHVRARR